MNLRAKMIRQGVIRVLLICALLGLAPVGHTQVNMEAYRDYFLVGQFGEVCTMCEVVILCDSGNSEDELQTIPATGTFTVYHLETRTFWSQVSTIWEWFISNFRADSLAASGHTRPANVYRVENGRWLTPTVVVARLILDPGMVELEDTYIDRVNREWLTAATSRKLGHCQRMPLWESLETIAAKTGDNP